MESFPQVSSPEHYMNLISLSSDLFAICSRDRRFKALNKAWSHIMGYADSDFSEKSFFDCVHLEDWQKAREAFDALEKSQAGVSFEIRFRTGGGAYRNLLWSLQPDEKSTHIYAVARDISEEKTTREQGTLQQQDLHDIFSQMPALAAIAKGPELSFEFANSDYRALIGHRDPIGKTVAEVLPELTPEIFEILNRVYRTGESYIAREFPMKANWKGDGKFSTKYFNFIYKGIRDEAGNPYGIWCVAFDVTEFKEIEGRLRISERMAALGTMSAAIAHEINNPLAFISGSLDLIHERIKNLDQVNLSESKKLIFEKLENAQKQMDHLRALSKSFKVFSHHEAAPLVPVNLNELLKSVVSVAENEIHLRAQLSFEQADAPIILGNEGQLSQVFLNILLNAAQAIDLGQVESNQIGIRTRLGKQGQAVVKITDTGCGIQPENLDRIFEPFFTSKEMGFGSGLGLSICQSILKLHHGTIEVKSDVGKGTAFTIELPLAHSSSSTESPVLENFEKKVSCNSQVDRLQILVIDDNRRFAGLVGEMLELRHQVEVTTGAKDALTLLSSGKCYDVILCDLTMPILSGLDFYKLVKEEYPDHLSRIVVMSGGAMTGESKQFLNCISNLKLQKPFNLAELNGILESFEKKSK